MFWYQLAIIDKQLITKCWLWFYDLKIKIFKMYLVLQFLRDLIYILVA